MGHSIITGIYLLYCCFIGVKLLTRTKNNGGFKGRMLGYWKPSQLLHVARLIWARLATEEKAGWEILRDNCDRNSGGAATAHRICHTALVPTWRPLHSSPVFIFNTISNYSPTPDMFSQ